MNIVSLGQRPQALVTLKSGRIIDASQVSFGYFSVSKDFYYVGFLDGMQLTLTKEEGEEIIPALERHQATLFP